MLKVFHVREGLNQAGGRTPLLNDRLSSLIFGAKTNHAAAATAKNIAKGRGWLANGALTRCHALCKAEG